MRAILVTLVGITLAGTGVTAGQAQPGQAAPAQPPAALSAPAAAQAAPEPPPAIETYTYQSEGRRDPFTNLLGTGLEPKASSRKGEGPSGMSVNEINVRGVMDSRGALIAMVQGPDSKTYIVHAGDKFLDGVIKTITTQGLVVVQDVNDPLSLVKQREIRKMLRSAEDAKK